jgi:hypothetical protein
MPDPVEVPQKSPRFPGTRVSSSEPSRLSRRSMSGQYERGSSSKGECATSPCSTSGSLVTTIRRSMPSEPPIFATFSSSRRNTQTPKCICSIGTTAPLPRSSWRRNVSFEATGGASTRTISRRAPSLASWSSGDYSTPEVEARQVALAIAGLMGQGCAPQRIAILYRVGAIGLPLQTALQELAIPCEIRGGADL